jgi:hypothetical protein
MKLNRRTSYECPPILLFPNIPLEAWPPIQKRPQIKLMLILFSILWNLDISSHPYRLTRPHYHNVEFEADHELHSLRSVEHSSHRSPSNTPTWVGPAAFPHTASSPTRKTLFPISFLFPFLLSRSSRHGRTGGEPEMPRADALPAVRSPRSASPGELPPVESGGAGAGAGGGGGGGLPWRLAVRGPFHRRRADAPAKCALHDMLLSQDRPPPGAWRHEGGLPRRRATTADAGELLLLPDLPDQTLLGRQPSAVFFFSFLFF